MAQLAPLKIDLTAGVVAQMGSGDTITPTLLGTGTPNGTKFLRDDGAWIVPGVSIGGAVSGGTASRVLYVDGSGNLAQDADFQFDGVRVGIGGAPSSDAKLLVTSVAGDMSGTTQYGVKATTTISSAAISEARGVYSFITTPAESFTCGLAANFTAGGFSIGAGSSITQRVGLYVLDFPAGGSGNIGMYSDVSSGTGRYHLYLSGSAASYMAGALLLGSATAVDAASRLELTGATQNWIAWNTNGVAAPTVSTRSAGTKLVLYPNLSGSQVDFAFGIEGNCLWSSVEGSTSFFNWYWGTSNSARLKFDSGGVLMLGDAVERGRRLAQKAELLTSANYGGMALTTFSSTSAVQAPVLDFNRSKHNTLGNYTAVESGDVLGYLMFRGSDGDEFVNAAYITATTNGSVSNNTVPGRLDFYAAVSASDAPNVFRMTSTTISSYKNFVVNGASLYIASTLDETASQLYSYSNANSLWLLQATTSRFVLGTAVDNDLGCYFEYTPGTVGAGAGLLSIGQTLKNHANFTHGSTRFYTSGLERMRLTATGVMVLGGVAPQGARNGMLAEIVTSATYGGAALTAFTTTSAQAPALDFSRSKSATIGTMTAVVSGDVLGHIYFRGADGTNFIDSSAILGKVDGSVATGAVPGRMEFYTYDSGGTPRERMRITSTGLLDLFYGQIKFPATQNASSDVNTLDDYEEGTWTPVLKFGGTSTGITYGIQSGKYTKIGRLCVWEFRIQLTSKGTATGIATVDGLPFTAGGLGSVHSGYFALSNTSNTYLGGYISGAAVQLFKHTSGGGSTAADTDFSNTSDLIMSGFNVV